MNNDWEFNKMQNKMTKRFDPIKEEKKFKRLFILALGLPIIALFLLLIIIDIIYV